MILEVKIKPNSKKGPLIIKDANSWTIYIREPAIENKANLAAIKLISNELNIPKTKISLIKGAKSKHKIFEIK